MGSAFAGRGHDTGGEPSGWAAEDRPCHITSASADGDPTVLGISKVGPEGAHTWCRTGSAVARAHRLRRPQGGGRSRSGTGCGSAFPHRRRRGTEWARKTHLSRRGDTQNPRFHRARTPRPPRRILPVLKSVSGPAPPVRDRSTMIATRMETEPDSVAPLSSHPDPRVPLMAARPNPRELGLSSRTDQV